MKWVLLLLLGSLAWAVQAAEFAYTVRATELKAKPYTDAATLATLAGRSKVEIIVRKGGWTKLRANGHTGWVRMLSLRFADTAAKKSGDTGLGALFNIATTGSSGSTVATGVRGLSEENLKNPHPNPRALQQLHGFKVSAGTARNFARAGRLKAEKMAFLPNPGQGAK